MKGECEIRDFGAYICSDKVMSLDDCDEFPEDHEE